MKTKQTKQTTQTTETVGREYTRTCYEVHYRRTTGDKWRRSPYTYATLEEAKTAVAEVGQRYQDLGGGFSLDMGPATDLVEYRIVQAVAKVTVLYVELKKV